MLRFVGVIDVEKGVVKADLEKYVTCLRWRRTLTETLADTQHRIRSRPRLVDQTTSSCSTRRGTARGHSLCREQGRALLSLQWA